MIFFFSHVSDCLSALTVFFLDDISWTNVVRDPINQASLDPRNYFITGTVDSNEATNEDDDSFVDEAASSEETTLKDSTVVESSVHEEESSQIDDEITHESEAEVDRNLQEGNVSCEKSTAGE